MSCSSFTFVATGDLKQLYFSLLSISPPESAPVLVLVLHFGANINWDEDKILLSGLPRNSLVTFSSPWLMTRATSQHTAAFEQTLAFSGI